jgi:putative intracellular protease/amidase
VKDAQLVHPRPEELADFAVGRLAPAERAEIERHLARCPHCSQLLREVPNDTFIERLRKANAPQANTPAPTGATRPGGAAADPKVPVELANHSRYRIVRALGAGGMGMVFQAEHRLMERPVALKVINPDLLSDPLAVERFRREVKAAARLTHPNIVTAHDAEQAGKLHFLVMEYVEGVSLAAYAEKRRPLPVAHACHFVRQAAAGLQHAHDQGMVHRDIKPQNLMLTRKGQVKILDFGLARFVRERDFPDQPAQAQSMPGSVSGLTSHDAVLGTPDYIAPEQASNARSADIRADIYSLGCTLYYLLAGQVPYPTGSSIEKLIAHVEDKPRPLSELRGDVPAEVVRVVERMMAKEPGQRYQTPAEVVAALTPFARIAPRLEEGVQGADLVKAPAAGQAAGLAAADKAVQAIGKLSPGGKPKTPVVSRRTALLAGGGTALLVIGSLLAFGRFGGGNPSGKKPPSPNPTAPVGKTGKVLLILASRDFWNPDFEPVKRVIEEGGLTVRVASSRSPAAPDPKGGGTDVVPDLLLNQVRVADYDAIIFIGGVGAIEYKQSTVTGHEARRVIEETLADPDKWLGAICMAPGVLAHWGVLAGKPATGYIWVRDMMIKEGKVDYKDQPLVVTGRIITGRSDKEADLFAREMVRLLKGR